MAKQAIRYVYPIVFIDCVHFNVKTDNMVTKKAAYVVLGVNENGYKEIFGIWIGENETAKFRLAVLTDLKNRGVKDILIICSDGLSGIKQAIESAFPNTVQQRCIVHLIRNSCKYLSIYLIWYKKVTVWLLNTVTHQILSLETDFTQNNLQAQKIRWIYYKGN